MPTRRLKAIKGKQIQSRNGERKNISSEHAWKQKFIAFNRLLSPKKGDRQYQKFLILAIALQRLPTFL